MAKTLVALIVWLCLATPGIAAQGKSQAKKAPRPAWSELTPAQQEVLAPLAPEWERLNTTRRKKWVSIADRYPDMKAKEQQRLQKRMRDWAALTPEQRAAAREKYQKLRKMRTDKRKKVKAEWERYQRALAEQQEREGASPEPPAADPQPDTAQAETPRQDADESERATQPSQ